MNSEVDQQKLLRMFHEQMTEALQRLEMARQTVVGAEREALLKEARFQGAVELAAGGPARWSFNPDDGVTFEKIETPSQAVESGPMPKAGPHGTQVKEK